MSPQSVGSQIPARTAVTRLRKFLRAGAVPQKRAPSLSGNWDVPELAAAGRPIGLHGTARSGRSSRPVVRARIDGVEVAHTLASPSGNGEWTLEVPTSSADANSVLSLVVSDSRESHELGSVRLSGPPAGARGQLDLPVSCAEVRVGGILALAGWVLFDGSPADRVVAFVGDEPPIPLRRAQPRPDLVAAMGDGSPGVIAGGFTGMVAVSEGWYPGVLKVRVCASMADGRVWTSPEVAVNVGRRPEHPMSLQPGVAIGSRLSKIADTAAPLRVCVFTHSLNLGGGELYLQELLLRLRRDHGVQILVVSPMDGPLGQELRDAGIDVHVTNHYQIHVAYYMGRVQELALIVRAYRADVVLGNTLGVFAGVDAGLECGLPVVWAIHESFGLEVFAFLNWGEHAMHPEVEARWRRCLAGAHTIFEAQTTLTLFAAEVPDLRGRRVRYGIDLAGIERYRRAHDRTDLRSDIGIAPDQTVLLCMGVFQERKAQLALVMAFARIAQLFPESVLVLVGDHPSPYATSVRAAVQAVGLGDRIRIVQIQPDTYRWYRIADILVSASDTESLPRSMLEAMAFGVPVLAADVYGLSEVIDDKRNGWLFQPLDGAALTVGMFRALSCSPEDRVRMSHACLDDATEFDGAGYASEYADLMRNLVATNRVRLSATAPIGGTR